MIPQCFVLYCTLSIGIFKSATFSERIWRVWEFYRGHFLLDFCAQGVTLKSKALATKCKFQIYSQLLDICTQLVWKTAEELFVPSVHSCNTLSWNNILWSILCVRQFSNRQCVIVFNWELQIKSERNPFKVWSSYTTATATSFSLKSLPSLQDINVAEYSEYEFKYSFWDVRQWVTQSVIGISLRRMPSFICV